MDEYAVLEYGQVFFQSSTTGMSYSFILPFPFAYHPKDGKKNVILGRVFVVRSPSLHPGDVRVLDAVDKPGINKFTFTITLIIAHLF